VSTSADPHDQFPPGFFSREDESMDARFYAYDRFVTHIDDGAIAAVGALYRELGIDGEGDVERVLDFMSSWISHFRTAPRNLVVLGMNERELAANTQADRYVVHDLNVNPEFPFENASFDAATCCVSIDYLTRPIDVLRDAARIVKPGGVVVCTFSNRCFPTKVIRGWLMMSEAERCMAVSRYFEFTGLYDKPEIRRCTLEDARGDPLYAVWART
jgi:SAM-dependent methyltransferase